MAALIETPAVNAAIAGAQTLPTLIRNFRAISPALADRFMSKPLVYSRTVWGTLLATLLAWASTRWGLGLDRDTVDLVVGTIMLIATTVLRSMTTQPIAGLVRTPAAPRSPTP